MGCGEKDCPLVVSAIAHQFTCLCRSFVRQHVLRFAITQLDVACVDPRFPPDAFVEMIFSPWTARGAAAAATDGPEPAASGVRRPWTPVPGSSAETSAASEEELLQDAAEERALWEDVQRRRVRGDRVCVYGCVRVPVCACVCIVWVCACVCACV